jgi:hypothetical protein
VNDLTLLAYQMGWAGPQTRKAVTGTGETRHARGRHGFRHPWEEASLSDQSATLNQSPGLSGIPRSLGPMKMLRGSNPSEVCRLHVLCRQSRLLRLLGPPVARAG